MDRRLFTTVTEFAASVATDSKPAQLAGYAMRWNSLSDDRGGYQVRLLPGSAFATNPTQALYNHDRGQVIGNTANGSLRVSTDDVGVRVEIDLPDTSYARDVANLVRDGYVAGMSFHIANTPVADEVKEGGKRIFNVKRFDFDEVSVLGSPSFTDTSIGIRHFSAFAGVHRAQLQLHQAKLNLYRLAGEAFVRRAV